jgi:LysR family glycine cleavage system transcriptional activator
MVLVHSYWLASDIDVPTWLSFREELHAIEAVVAGQGIGIFCDVLVEAELASGTLVKTSSLSLPGYRFYLVLRHDHPREKIIR